MSHQSSVQIFVDKLENALIHGRARWMADLNEFFRNFRFNNTTFELYARGRTRNKGLFLSRLFAWTALPDYAVSLFVGATESGRLSLDGMRKILDVTLQLIRTKGLQWAWLILLSERELSPQVVSFVSRYDRKELGLASASILTGELVVSNTHVGQSIRKQLKLGKLLKGFRPEQIR